jgi:hypothetical protein
MSATHVCCECICCSLCMKNHVLRKFSINIFPLLMCLVSIFLVMCPLPLSTCCLCPVCVRLLYFGYLLPTNLFKRFVVHFAIAVKDYAK